MASALSLQSSTTSIDRQEQSGLSQLPPETIIHVLVHSKIQGIAAFGTTCKSYSKISHDKQRWHTLFVKDFNFKPSGWTTPILTFTPSTRTWTADLAEGSNLAAYKTQVNLYKRIPGALIQLKQMLGIAIL